MNEAPRRVPPSPVLEYDYPAELFAPAPRRQTAYDRLRQAYTHPTARLSLNDDVGPDKAPQAVLPCLALFTSVVLGFVLSYGVDYALDKPPNFENRTQADYEALLAFTTKRSSIARWLDLPGTLFVRALSCLVVPLIFVNLAMGVAELVQTAKLGRVTAKMLLLFALTTMAAAGQGLLWMSIVPEERLRTNQTNIFQVDTRPRRLMSTEVLCPLQNETYLVWKGDELSCSNEKSSAAAFQMRDSNRLLANVYSARRSVKKLSVVDVIQSIFQMVVPSNLFASFVQGDLLSVVAFVVPFGLAIARIFTIMIAWVIQTAPVAVLFMVASTLLYPEDNNAASYGWAVDGGSLLSGVVKDPSALPFEQILARSEYFFDNLTAEKSSMLTFLGLYLAGWVLHCFVFLPTLVLLTTSHAPWTFLRRIIPALSFGFFSASALASMPLLMKFMHLSQFVSRHITRLVVPVGTGVHMDGVALYVSSAMVFLLRTQSYDRSAPVPEAFLLNGAMYAIIFVCATVASWTMPPLPHNGLLGLTFVWFTVVGEVRPTNLHWMIAMDVVTDRLSTVGTMISNAIVTLIIASSVDERYADEQDRRVDQHEWLSE
ncbi:hypothetical protein SPRG_15070 [Saprolegnia parasitica CBS 223.65]|uniref:Amino acid transporter n=1 Tax=Saprolegnia parasitica (strain CBS 223.65) TaxID=695850 RepID=A0A067BSF5_SAPPC|nr:hypothetical protein SPRG_15070 [Saprolegnia parasitica CBS 223.65]KDO19740.1 hypothetical protein SPRG_15070 [Saprolegnia parasitica CBS 223.65]|eukprot:XP_012209551.1 hypothetical protein SPRG_15070 [Saprolegnia parasitica CBS 223.65]